MTTACSYGILKKTGLSYEDAVEEAKAALKTEGFGILTQIDVKSTIKEKTGADFRKYVILGSCNPQLAHQALQAETNIGLMLPCNVIVYEEGEGSVVAAQDPQAMMEFANNPALAPIAEEARARLERVINAIG